MKGSVLVVENNINDRIIAVTLLRARGFHVHVVEDVTEVCEIVSRQEPNVVLLELELSGMNGLELVRRLRGRFGPLPVRSQPGIIVAAATIHPDTEQFIRRLGADEVMHKPLVPGRFLDSVDRLVASRRTLRAVV